MTNAQALVNGWSTAPLGELLDFVIGGDWGKSPDYTDPDYVPVLCIRASEVKNWKIDKGSTAALRSIKRSSLERRRLREDDLIIEISGGGPDQPVGRTLRIDRECLARSTDTPKICTNFFRLMRPSAHITSSYLQLFLEHFYATRDMNRYQGGSNNLRNLKFDDYLTIKVPIAPTREQGRIVAKIEELFSELDKGVQALTTAREQLVVYRLALFDQAVSGALLVSRCISRNSFALSAWRPLSEVVTELGQGWSPRCLNHPSASEDIWAVITTTAIQHGSFHDEENKELPAQLEPRPHLTITPGDILVTRAGPRKRVGVACLVRKCRPRLMLCDKSYRLRSDKGRVLPQWLELVLNSPRVLQDIEELKTGISDSGVNLTQDRFLALSAPIPPLELQKRTVEIVETVMSQIENQIRQIDTTLLQSSVLRQSILKKAFAGELVGQDPRDEPAPVLLARIRADRNGASTTKTRNGRYGKEMNSKNGKKHLA